MAGNFSDIPVRGYTLTDPSWWNILRTAGMVLQNLLGAASGSIADTQFTFANNQSTANVTGLVFDSTVGKRANIWISVRRVTNSVSIISEVEMWLSYDTANSTWLISDYIEHGNPTNITWSITAGGQVQYATDNQSGTGYTGVSRFSAFGMGT